MPWKVLVSGKEVDVYEAKKHKAASHPTVQIQDSKGGVLNLAPETGGSRIV